MSGIRYELILRARPDSGGPLFGTRWTVSREDLDRGAGNEAISRVFAAIVGSKDVDLGTWSSFCVYLRLHSALGEQADSSHRTRQIETLKAFIFTIGPIR